MKQFIVKIGGGEPELDKAFGIILSEKLKIVTLSIAGGGFMGGGIVTYIVIEGDSIDSVIKRCQNYMYYWDIHDTIPKIDADLNAGKITLKKATQKKDDLKRPIDIQIVEETII